MNKSIYDDVMKAMNIGDPMPWENFSETAGLIVPGSKASKEKKAAYNLYKHQAKTVFNKIARTSNAPHRLYVHDRGESVVLLNENDLMSVGVPWEVRRSADFLKKAMVEFKAFKKHYVEGDGVIDKKAKRLLMSLDTMITSAFTMCNSYLQTINGEIPTPVKQQLQSDFEFPKDWDD